MKSSFQDIVELYRLCGLPDIEGGVFGYSGPMSDALCLAVSQLEKEGSEFGEVLDTVDYSEPLSFEISVFCNSRSQFCDSFREVINQAKTLCKGISLENVYVKNLDWSSHDFKPCSEYDSLVNACTLVRTLSELSDAADLESSPNYNILYLELPQKKEGMPSSCHLKTIILPEVVGLTLRHIKLIEGIKSQVDAGAVHAEERAQILWGAISEVLDESADSASPFYYLMQEWDLVLRKYRHNLQIYLKKFSFEKLRHELCQATVEHSQKVGSAFGDIASKLLALPLSVILLERLYSSSDSVSKVVYFFGLCLVSIIMASMVENQKLIFARMKSAQGLLFAGIQSGKEFLSKEIREFMDESKIQAEAQERHLEKVIRLFRWLSWVPILAGFYLMFFI